MCRPSELHACFRFHFNQPGSNVASIIHAGPSPTLAPAPPQVSLNFDEIMLLTDNSTLRYLSLTSHLSVAMDISFKSGELWGFLSILQSLLLLCLQHDFPSECTPVGSPAGGVRQPLQAGPQELLCPVLSCRRLSICSNHFMETATTNLLHLPWGQQNTVLNFRTTNSKQRRLFTKQLGSFHWEQGRSKGSHSKWVNFTTNKQ